VENMTPVQRLAEDMRSASTNQVLMWIDSAMMWAANAEMSNSSAEASMAREIISTLSRIPIRPFYSPEELAMLFPMISTSMYGANKGGQSTTSGRISKELREGGVPYLECIDDPKGFKVKGQYRQYLVIADHDEWEKPLSQDEFDRMASQWPSYGQVRNLQNKSQRK